MPRLSPNHDFNIYVDPSNLRDPMDRKSQSSPVEVEHRDPVKRTGISPKPAHVQDEGESDIHPSIEDDEHAATMAEDSNHQDEGADSSSSQHDEDVFSDKSMRSSIGSYDGGSESGKGLGDCDNMTTIRSPCISDISQYDKEDFIPTARGTPRPPFRTPSDVRAMQMSSPTPSVLGSPRAAKKQFPTVSRLGTPSGSAQYSPKRKSTPPRFKSRLEAPLVLLHVTLLPLRWVWGDIVNNLDPAEMSNQAKTLRDAWQMLQDRVGDTVIERGILLGHPQNDYEVLEERLLDALELPLRRRARILECGHYLGPANESTIDDEDSEDDYEDDRRHSGNKRHWCKTCKHDIRYESLGAAKIFRVKVYASNGLMKAGAWAACWKEMERVDVELEPVVEGAVQDEIVRLAAQQDQHIEHEEDDDSFEEEMAEEMDEQHQDKKRDSFHPDVGASPPQESNSDRRRREAERYREIYGHSPPPTEDHSHESFSQESYSPHPSAQSPQEETYERRDAQRHTTQTASMPELLIQSARVLMQDRKNVVIFTLGVLVLMLALRNAPRSLPQEPIIHGINHVPDMQRVPVMKVPEASINQGYQSPIVVDQQTPIMDSIVASILSYEQQYSAVPEEAPHTEFVEIGDEIPASQMSQEATRDVSREAGPIPQKQDQIPHVKDEKLSAAVPPQPTSLQHSVGHGAGASTAREHSETLKAVSKAADEPVAPLPSQSEVTETVTQKRVVRVVHTVTETETETQTQTQTQTATETFKVETTQVVEAPSPTAEHSSEAPAPEATVDAQDAAAVPEAEEREPIIVEASFAAAEPIESFEYSAAEPEAPSQTTTTTEAVPEPTRPLTAAEVEALLEEREDQKPEEDEPAAGEGEAPTAPLATAPERTSPFVDLGELPAIEGADADAKDRQVPVMRREEEEEPFTLAKACEAFLVNRELQLGGVRVTGADEPEATTPAEDLICATC
ncbi:hypothetical protein F5X99DRAFT_381155 [Biscogniauxia marginata]|nr:hypothetical protein F5X99DRAFT_381155 [Biscogniauxia marginata]